MADGANTTLDGFKGRSNFHRQFNKPTYIKREVRHTRPRAISDISPPPKRRSFSRKLTIADLDSLYAPKARVAQTSNIGELPKLAQTNELITAQQEHEASHNKKARSRNIRVNYLARSVDVMRQKNKLQVSLVSLAVLMLVIGSYVSFTAWQTIHIAQAAAAELTKQANKAAVSGSGSTQALSTITPTAKTIASYAVAPNLPKYLKIPSIGVDAIVGQTGILANGALGTPDNIFYTDWDTGSAAPGQPGATLIDGHVSSWTVHGVFYNLHDLKAGDTIQIVKGDNTVVNYTVVKTQVYQANNVDMQAALTPITPGVSGLNLITCTGQVIKGTSLFNERVIVFAQETP